MSECHDRGSGRHHNQRAKEMSETLNMSRAMVGTAIRELEAYFYIRWHWRNSLRGSGPRRAGSSFPVRGKECTICFATLHFQLGSVIQLSVISFGCQLRLWPRKWESVADETSRRLTGRRFFNIIDPLSSEDYPRVQTNGVKVQIKPFGYVQGGAHKMQQSGDDTELFTTFLWIL